MFFVFNRLYASCNMVSVKRINGCDLSGIMSYPQ